VSARVLGLVGWSGSGKTTLLIKLLPLLRARGLKVATLKHAHHAFDIDLPGKDSFAHRAAGATEVLVSSARRWAQVHELRDEPEATLAQLLRRVSPCDLILVEGYKRERHRKLEVFRRAVRKAPLHPQDTRIVAVASDQTFAGARVPVVDLNDVAAIAELVTSHAEPLEAVLAALESA
jgi:molybdopterin-guanine dinucleotide biosynthesis adapter protein